MTINPIKLRLSTNFTLQELIHSNVAMDHGITNVPGEAELGNLIQLTNHVLQHARTTLGPLFVTSGFRCLELNGHPRIGSKPTSQHVRGEAADLWRPDLVELFMFIHDTLPFDQLIFEFGKWIHVSFNREPRTNALVADREGFHPFTDKGQLHV